MPKYAEALNDSEGSPTSAAVVRGGSAVRLCRASVRRSAEVQMVAIRSNLFHISEKGASEQRPERSMGIDCKSICLRSFAMRSAYGSTG